MSVRSSRAITRGKAVGMAGDDVAAELVADLERALEIDARARSPAPTRGHAQRLGGGIDREPGAVAVPAARDHGEAHAAAGDRGADGDGVRIVAAGDLEPREPLARAARLATTSPMSVTMPVNISLPLERLEPIRPDGSLPTSLSRGD